MILIYFVFVIAFVASNLLFKRPCKHLFKGKEMQSRDENGIVKWQCCKCKKVFAAECGLDILRHGKCDGVW